MICDGTPCRDCSRNCLLVHQNQKNGSPAVFRFFKIMIGDDYQSVLYLPPGFLRKVQIEMGQASFLEDSIGKRWPVTFTIIDGSLAIQKGWRQFAADHHLEVGEFLIFTYIKGSHFFVQIYGKSGCERFYRSSSGRQKRRHEKEEETLVPGEPFQTLYTKTLVEPAADESMFKFQHGQCLPESKVASNPGSDTEKKQFIFTTRSMDDSVVMLNINRGCNQVEERTYLHDLSIFEMGSNESRPHKMKKSSLGEETVPNGSHVGKQTQPTENYAHMEMDKEGCSSGLYKDVLLDKSAAFSAENCNMRKGTADVVSNEGRNNILGSIPGSKVAEFPKHSGFSCSIPVVKNPFDRQKSAVQRELVEVASGLPQISNGEQKNMAVKCAPMASQHIKDINAIVKAEPEIQSALIPYFAAGPPSAKVKCLSYLELPTSLTPFEGKDEGEMRGVFLRDPTGRLWPVMHYSRPLGVTVLVNGWKEFCQENNIQPGDICEFRGENRVQLIYAVRVLGKSVS